MCLSWGFGKVQFPQFPFLRVSHLGALGSFVGPLPPWASEAKFSSNLISFKWSLFLVNLYLWTLQPPVRPQELQRCAQSVSLAHTRPYLELHLTTHWHCWVFTAPECEPWDISRSLGRSAWERLLLQGSECSHLLAGLRVNWNRGHRVEEIQEAFLRASVDRNSRWL